MSDSTARRPLKSVLWFFLKIAFSAIVLYLIFLSIDIKQLAVYFKNAGMKTFFAVFVSGVGIWLMEYLRFAISLKPVINNPPQTPLWRVFFSGYALRFVIPGGHGEVGKMTFVSGRYSHRIIAYLMDKGSLAIVVLIGGLIGVWKLYPDTRIYYGLLLFIVPVVYFGAKHFIRKKKKSLSDTDTYPFNKVLIANVPLSIFHVMIMAFQYWLVLNVYRIPFLSIYTTVNIVLVAIMIPISFAGMGVREWTTLQLLTYYAIPKESAILAPLLVFLCNVFIPALIGVIIILVFQMKPVLFSRKKEILHQH